MEISDEIELKRTGIKQVVFNKSENAYQFFVEEKRPLPRLFNLFKKRNRK